jgi:carboxypeptidase PM20D1
VDDPGVEVRFVGTSREASAVSPADSAAYAFLQHTIAAHFGDAVVAPALVLGGTDARHYVRLSDHVYRFLPWLFGQDDLRAHGIDERLSVQNLAVSIRFYVNLMRAASEARLDGDGAAAAGT